MAPCARGLTGKGQDTSESIVVKKRPVGVGAVAAEGQCDRGKDMLGRGLRCAKELTLPWRQTTGFLSLGYR